PARIVEAVGVPDSVFEKIASGKDKLKEMGIDPSKFGLRQLLAILENNVSGEDLKKLEELGITDPAAIPATHMVELLQTADTLKDFDMIDPKILKPEQMLDVIRLIRSFPDPAKVQAHLNEYIAKSDAFESGEELVGALHEASEKEAESRRQE